MGLLLGALLSCGGVAEVTEGQLRARAAQDMKCLDDTLALDHIGDSKTIAVSGCGRRFVYKERCFANTGECAWVLLSDARSR